MCRLSIKFTWSGRVGNHDHNSQERRPRHKKTLVEEK